MEQLRYLLGIVTLVAVGAAGWVIFQLLTEDQLSDHVHLTVRFGDAHGLRSGADVRFRGVRVGEVLSVRVDDDDDDRVSINVVLQPEHVPTQSSRFWIVAPRFLGLTGGATGLDTLVRDPYVAFATPNAAAPPLAPNSVIAGDERPFSNPAEAGLEPERHGDLRMELFAHESFGLRVGHEVRFRGIRVGDVRGIGLSREGHHVVIELRVAQAHRNTVTDASEFWIARPRLSGALMSGLAIEDLEAMLSPFVAYKTVPERGVPVADGHRSIARPTRSELVDPEIELSERDPTPTAGPEDGLQLVEVVYEAVERDWWSPNDRVTRRSTGILYIDRTGRFVVATARSGCDAAYFMRDLFSGAPDVVSERWSVSIPGSVVVRAGRSWVASDGRDLAVLVLENPPRELPFTSPEQFEFGALPTSGSLEFRDFEGNRTEGDVGALPELAPAVRGQLALREGRTLGLLGQTDGTTVRSVVVPFALLPEALRPQP